LVIKAVTDLTKILFVIAESTLRINHKKNFQIKLNTKLISGVGRCAFCVFVKLRVMIFLKVMNILFRQHILVIGISCNYPNGHGGLAGPDWR
jgi:hypothetical protein